MAKVTMPFNFQNTNVNKLAGTLTRFLRDLMGQINGGLDFTTNIRASQLLTVPFTAANTNVIVTHNMGIIPTGFLIVNTSSAMHIFQGTNAWTIATLTLQSSAVGTAYLYAI